MNTSKRRSDLGVAAYYSRSVMGEPSPGVVHTPLHRSRGRQLPVERLGTAILVACDGKELKVQLSNGDVYRVDLRGSVARWRVPPEDLKDVVISRDGMVLVWPRSGSELSVATIIGATNEQLSPLAGRIKPTRSIGADPGIADEYDFSHARFAPWTPGLKEGSLHRLDRFPTDHELGVAVRAGCDGYEVRVTLSNGDTYRVDVSRAAKHWCLMREDLRPVEIRGGGTRLYWPRLCSEMSVATLIGTTEERLATLAAVRLPSRRVRLDR